MQTLLGWLLLIAWVLANFVGFFVVQLRFRRYWSRGTTFMIESAHGFVALMVAALIYRSFIG